MRIFHNSRRGLATGMLPARRCCTRRLCSGRLFRRFAGGGRRILSARRAGFEFLTMTFIHKNIRLHPSHYIGQRWCFVTMCCASRQRIFAVTKNAARLMHELRAMAATQPMAVFAYCVMPDHLHLLLHGTEAMSDVLAFVKNFKQATGAEFERKFRRDLWQKKFYDHILRPNDSPEGVAKYIWMNPVRKGICQNPQEYPFSGSFVVDWNEIARVTKPWVPTWKTGQPG
jgi:putative transposase